MGRIREKFSASILSTIRARRESASAPQGEQPSYASGGLPPAVIREASFSDFDGVAALKQRWGVAADSMENWERLWRHNPALMQQNCERPIGWVLEADGVVVGYLGNISLLCRYGDRTLTAVASHALVVDPPYRAIGVSLVAAFFRQKSADLFVSTSAIESVGRMALAFKCSPVPQPDYGTVLFWVLKPHPFVRALMKKLELKPAVSRIVGALTSAAIGTDRMIGRRRPRRPSAAFSTSEISVNEIGDKFQTLWMQKLNENPRLLTDRSPAALRWHYEIPGDRGSVRVLCCHQNGELCGFAVVRSDTDEQSGLNKSIIADIIVRHDDGDVAAALCFAAYDYAQRLGSHVLEVVGFPDHIRNVCEQGNPYRRKLPACPFFYKSANPAFDQTLLNSNAWYACPFDGDATLIRPSYSRPALREGSGMRIAADKVEIVPHVLKRARTQAS
jgi:hypothetical protein